MKRISVEHRKKRQSTSKHSIRYHLFGKAKVRLLHDKAVVDTQIANVSFSGIGLYSLNPIANGREVKMKISFFDITGKIQTATIIGSTVWHSKLANSYLMGIRFNEELTASNQPLLFNRIMLLQTKDT
jgi:hypothetical protein